MKFACLVVLLAIAVLPAGASDTPPGSAATEMGAAVSKAKVIDVRTPEEFESGHIEGAVNIPLQVLEAKIGGAVPDKNSPVMVHCQSGGRSARAKATLDKLGYKHVTDLGSLAHARQVLKGK